MGHGWERPRLRDVPGNDFHRERPAGQEQLLENESQRSASSVHSGLAKPARGPCGSGKFISVARRGAQKARGCPCSPGQPCPSSRLRPAPRNLPVRWSRCRLTSQSQCLSSAPLPTPYDVRARRFPSSHPRAPPSARPGLVCAAAMRGPCRPPSGGSSAARHQAPRQDHFRSLYNKQVRLALAMSLTCLCTRWGEGVPRGSQG